ncbi:MAG: NfeD family protein [candidate division Zixibacteria bacterium]|nr:NfeD family protein [candidate division Zixibacteria bacterium]
MPVYIWLILAAILIVIEIFTAGFFIACFALGALVAAGIAYVSPSMGYQAAGFVIVSVIAIPISRILAKRFAEDQTPQAGVDALIGKTAVVIEDIVPISQKGQVKIEGESWRALASDEIKVGETVKIIEVKGTMLKVQKLEGSK